MFRSVWFYKCINRGRPIEVWTWGRTPPAQPEASPPPGGCTWWRPAAGVSPPLCDLEFFLGKTHEPALETLNHKHVMQNDNIQRVDCGNQDQFQFKRSCGTIETWTLRHRPWRLNSITHHNYAPVARLPLQEAFIRFSALISVPI